MRLIGRAGRDGSDAGLDRKLANIFDDRRTPGAPESLYAYVREVTMTEQGPQAGRFTRMWRGLGRTGRIGVSVAAALVIVAGAATAVGLSRGGFGGPGAGPATPEPAPSTAPAPSGWRFLNGVGSTNDTGGTWGGAEVAGLDGRGYRVLAVHVICIGVDELVVMLSTGSSGGLTGQSLQSAVFRCALDRSAAESRVVLTAPDEPFTHMWVRIVRNPSSVVSNDWVVDLEVPEVSPSPSSSPSPAS